MRLKSIEMQGFKSFADKIYLDFNPGITAIVGPNGSGKSNISDAIRWVMGEQSAKSLRGSKMEDVIFSGTEARKPLGFAEVTLVLDNSDGYFSLDFPEITVTRRVYRSGEGEYYINKTLCRLKDVHELFMDTGLGRDGYSIIGQGKIDSILSTKSEDRRQIFEEAAGISKYKYRKAEAERKLTQATENLTRVEDILGELETRLEPLRVQSEKAHKYLNLRDEMRGLDIAVSVINAEKGKAELKTLQDEIAILSEQIGGIRIGLEETENSIASMYERIQKFDEEISACRETDDRSVSVIHETENQINLLKSDITHNEQNIRRLEEEIQASVASMEELDKTAETYQKNLEELNAKQQSVADALEELTAESQKVDQDAGEKNSVIEGMKAEIIELVSQSNALKASCDSLTVLTENFRQRQMVTEQEMNAKTEYKAKLLREQEEIAPKAETCKKQTAELVREVAKSEEEVAKTKELLQHANEQLNLQKLTIDKKKSRKKMLEDMEREFEGYGRGVKSVMQAYRANKIPNAVIYGPLSQLIRTEKKYISAIETALGAVTQNIVTKREEDAKEAIRYLKQTGQGRATFLPVTAIQAKMYDLGDAKRQEGFLAVASEVVECEDTYREVVNSFLGGTVICDTLDHAVAIAKKGKHKFRIVTLDGDVIQPGGAMTGGSRAKSVGSLSRTGEIESLEQEVSKLEHSIRKAEQERIRLTELLSKKEDEIKEKSAQLHAKQNEQIRLDAERKHLDELVEGLADSYELAEAEHTDVSNRLAEMKAEIEKKQQEMEAKAQACKEKEELMVSVEKEYSELSGRNSVLISRLSELNLNRNTVLKDMELERDRIFRLQTEKARYLDEVTTKSGGVRTLRERNADLEKRITEGKTTVEELQTSLRENRERLSQLAAERSETEVSVRNKQESVKGVQEQMFQLTQQQTKMETKAEKYETEIETIVNRLLEEYELPYSEAVKFEPDADFDFKEATAKIRSLKDKIRALGNINIDAIEEYKEIKERFDFLSTQSSDLKKAKGELEDVIEEMLTIMQSRFSEQFRVINTNFNRVFAELFGGGSANLTLTEPDNILESGIEIEAQPPGKKLQSLTLLSGGERAFTAIALLFAILDVRPTPFCILDEIEAALDDVNVYRTAEYLKNYSKKTQFIVVTHRRGTMEAANVLYGVTMQERGISKLLSLNIDEIQQ